MQIPQSSHVKQAGLTRNGSHGTMGATGHQSRDLRQYQIRTISAFADWWERWDGKLWRESPRKFHIAGFSHITGVLLYTRISMILLSRHLEFARTINDDKSIYNVSTLSPSTQSNPPRSGPRTIPPPIAKPTADQHATKPRPRPAAQHEDSSALNSRQNEAVSRAITVLLAFLSPMARFHLRLRDPHLPSNAWIGPGGDTFVTPPMIRGWTICNIGIVPVISLLITRTVSLPSLTVLWSRRRETLPTYGAALSIHDTATSAHNPRLTKTSSLLNGPESSRA